MPTTKAAAPKSQAVSYDIAKSDETLDLAKDLAKFIKENKLSTQVQGKEFVNVEGWQYAGSRLGIVPIVEHVINVSSDHELKYQAKVTLFDMRSQHTVGAGFAICSNKESGKKFYQEFAIASMAQTRAIGKAYRNILAWIIRAAGYEPTPAEEMEYAGNVPTAAPVAAEPAPVMRAVTNEPAAAEATPINYATASQKEEIIRLLNHPLITRQEKSKMLINIQRLDEERATLAISKLNRAIEDRAGQAVATGNEHVLTEGNEPAGETPAANNSAAPVASTTSDQSSEGQVEAVLRGATLSVETERGEAHLVARYPSGSADPEASFSTPFVAECARRLCAATSSLDVTDIWSKLTGGGQKELRVEKESALTRIKAAVQQAARTMVRQQPAVGIKDAGADTSLVAEFCEQPAVAGVEFVAATDEQRQWIQRQLDHPLITRREKTTLLLKINKLDKERARQCIGKLRQAIEDRENANTAGALRELLHKQLNEYGGILGEEIVADYALLVEDGEVSVERLRAALDEVRNVLSLNQDNEEEAEAQTAVAA